ncbi:MAG TPA: hypothetical protein VJ011_03825, partial [Steroidobacteraceae bacterium]|nr:hypothetical protein [Steroidobacteraceae bacterium]
MRVLIVDNDSVMLETIARTLRGGFSIDIVTSKGDALDLLRQNDFHVVVACEQLEDGSGLDLLSQTAKRWPETLRLFAASADRLALLRGRLGPFKLFQTLDYPVEPGPLGSILMLAQAAQAADADTANVQHIVLGEERATETDVPAPVVAHAAAGTAAQARTGGAARRLPFTVPTLAPAGVVARRKPLTREAIAEARHLAPPPAASAAPAAAPKAAAPRPPPRRSESPTGSFQILPSEAMRLQPMPTGFRAHRTQILIGSAVVAVLAALGIAISLSSGVDETEPGTAAPAAAHAPSTDIDPLIAEIETALTAADDASARAALVRLRRAAPSHPRLAFFDAILKRRESPVRPRAAAPTRPAPATREATTALVARGDLPRALEPGEAAAQSSDTTAANVPDIAAAATAP